MNLGNSRANPELLALIERVRHYKMTPEEVFEQRVSFVYGMQGFNDPTHRSKDEIRQSLIELYGRPPCPKCSGEAA